MNERYLAPSVKKAFDILRIISLSREGIGLNEIARALGIAKSTVHGIISALEDVGAVKRDPSTRRYELGLTLFELGRQIYTQIDLREILKRCYGWQRLKQYHYKRSFNKVDSVNILRPSALLFSR